MRLGLFDPIRRLAHRFRSTEAAGNAPQGRHRRDQQHPPGPGAPPGPGGRPVPAGAQESLDGAGTPAPDGLAIPRASFVRDAPPASPARLPGMPGAPAIRVGSAQARVREAPDEAAAPGLSDAAVPMPAAGETGA